MTLTPKIAIIGAGPAGLILARLLRVQGIEASIFEADTSVNSRNQGGSLDLRRDSGLQAMKEAGLWDEFLKYARGEGEDIVIADKTGKRWIDASGHSNEVKEGHGRPEIDREDLRKLLAESVEGSSIRWDSKLLRVGEDRVLQFAHGQEGPFDLIVGADGGKSHVRPLVSSARPFYTGITGLQFRLTDIDQRHPQISKMIGNGSFFTASDGKCLMAQRLGNRSIQIFACVKMAEGPLHRTTCLKEFEDWAPELKALMEFADTSPPPRTWPMYILPVDHRWAAKAGFTLVGDAAHLSTPFAGEGVNMVMLDSLELSRNIIRAVRESSDITALAAAVRSYEESMFPRVEKAAIEAEENKRLIFKEDAPKEFLEKLMGRGGGPPDVHA